jgi:hypothetical protein
MFLAPSLASPDRPRLRARKPHAVRARRVRRADMPEEHSFAVWKPACGKCIFPFSLPCADVSKMRTIHGRIRVSHRPPRPSGKYRVRKC